MAFSFLLLSHWATDRYIYTHLIFVWIPLKTWKFLFSLYLTSKLSKVCLLKKHNYLWNFEKEIAKKIFTKKSFRKSSQSCHENLSICDSSMQIFLSGDLVITRKVYRIEPPQLVSALCTDFCRGWNALPLNRKSSRFANKKRLRWSRISSFSSVPLRYRRRGESHVSDAERRSDIQGAVAA